MIVRQNVDPEFVTAPCETVYFEDRNFSMASAENSSTPYALTRMQFANESPMVFVVSSEDYVFAAGETVSLFLKICVWSPEHQEIEIGFWNTKTGTTYTKMYSDGSLKKPSPTLTCLLGHTN
ncbi:MAG: hypothetical protein IJ001_07370 [Oscillospiraceae bacterium]|nr:hypothetical protein [Oscillospiraceae bacterium]